MKSRLIPASVLLAFILTAGCSVIPMEWFESSVPQTPGYGSGIGVDYVGLHSSNSQANLFWTLLYSNLNISLTNVPQLSVTPSSSTYISTPWAQTNLTGVVMDRLLLGISQSGTNWADSQYKNAMVRVLWPNTNTTLIYTNIGSLSNVKYSNTVYSSGNANQYLVHGWVWVSFTNIRPMIREMSNLTVIVTDPKNGEVFHVGW